MDGGCNGGDQGNAWKFFNYFGLPQDSCMPYVSGNDSDHMPACPAKCADGSVMKKFYAASAYAVNKNEYDIMQEIYKNGPVTTGTYVMFVLLMSQDTLYFLILITTRVVSIIILKAVL